MDPAEPVRLLAGRYRLNSIIGSGGMGAVWRADDELLNRDVAVKEIIWPPHWSDAERQTARRRAVREAQMAARLSHPNVVAIYDIIEEDGRPWIVMELVPYRSLRDVVEEDGPLDPPQAAQIGIGILAALRAAHEQGVLHRDVKPANILVGPEGRVVLTDFGIARAADSSALTASGVLIGSPSYISPERARGERAGAAGDLWSLGASLYMTVEGKPPFDRDGALASLTAVVTDEPDPAPHAGPLWPLISGLLRKDPGKRLGAAETERMLHRVAANDGTTVPAPAVPAPAVPAPAVPAPAVSASAPQEGRRWRFPMALTVLAAAVIVIVVGGTTIALLSNGSPRHQAASGSHRHQTASPPVSPHPSPSVRPSATNGPSAPAGSPMPAGFYRFTNPTGFSIGVPRGWQVSHVDQYVYVRDPSNHGVFLLIDQSDHPKPNPLADWEQQQANRESSYPGYHLVRLQSVDYPQAEKAADWEFTYNRDGVPVHILNRNVLANAQHAYALYWSTPESDWTAYYHYFQTFAATFRPAL